MGEAVNRYVDTSEEGHLAIEPPSSSIELVTSAVERLSLRRSQLAHASNACSAKVIDFPSAVDTTTHYAKAASIFTPIIVLLLILQIFDGFLTAYGVSQLGLHAEGNPLIKSLMHLIGLTPAIMLAKSFCCIVIVVLAFQALKISWLRPILRVVAALYVVFAILPWTLLIFGNAL